MIICIVGPTGVGKSKLSISLAKKYNAEIINADAVQVFKDFNIGTAKISEEEMSNIPHHLIDFLDPSINYSVADYQTDARKILNKLLKENKNVIIVGGTGLYIKALLFDYEFDEVKSSDYSEFSNEELKAFADKIGENNIHINNRKRLERFIDRKSIKNNKDKLLYNTLFIGLTTSRKKLYEKVNSRVEDMFNNGLLEEAKSLYDKGIKRGETIIGYKELYSYFEGNISLEEAKELIKRNTRRYAKRQYTWFNNQMDIDWFNVDFNNFNKTINEVEDKLKKEF